MQRRTVTTAAEFQGITLFSGAQARVRVLPADAGAGIAFSRVDLPAHDPIPAHAGHVAPEIRRTVLAQNPSDRASPSVQTVEHLMSALAGLGVTDALVEIDGPELPIADGSALPFVEAILAAGLTSLNAHITPITIRERIEIDDARGPTAGKLIAEPGDGPGLELIYHLDYGQGAPIPPHTVRFVSNPGADNYAAAISRARTFSTLQEVMGLRQMGLFGHLTAAEMLVIGPDGPVDNEYRFSDEPARHKVLDMLGDLALAGRPIQGRVTAWRSGHALNHAMARKLAEAEGK